MNSLKELAEKLLEEWRHERTQWIEYDFWNTDSTSRDEYVQNQVKMDKQYDEWKEMIVRFSNKEKC